MSITQYLLFAIKFSCNKPIKWAKLFIANKYF